MRLALIVSIGLIVALALGGCKKDKEIAGFGRWNVKKTRLKDAMRCIPEKLHDGRDGSYCFGQHPVGIKGMPVDVDLYFGGTDPEATLVEIQLKVGGCRAEELEVWMRKNFGAPIESRKQAHAWKNAHLYAAGFLPLEEEPGRCVIRMIPVAESGRWDQVWVKTGGSP